MSCQARAGSCPRVALEATYGWYQSADALAAAGAEVHLAHPLGVKAFAYRRVKDDIGDATDLAVGVELLSEHTDLAVLGDKAYISAAEAAELWQRRRQWVGRTRERCQRRRRWRGAWR